MTRKDFKVLKGLEALIFATTSLGRSESRLLALRIMEALKL